MTIKLPAEIEARLRERAAAEGKDAEALAVEAVAARVGMPAGRGDLRDRPYAEWAAAFWAWVASHPALPYVADDSRESIYEGCGE